jgi:hypothetical protein
MTSEGSAQLTDIRQAVTVTSAEVSNAADKIKLSADVLSVSVMFSNHTKKHLTAAEIRISIFDAAGQLVTKRVIEKDDSDPRAADDRAGRYALATVTDSLFFVNTNYLSDLSLARDPMLIQLADPLPAREFDQIAEALRKSSLRIRVEPLKLTFGDGTVLTGVR